MINNSLMDKCRPAVARHWLLLMAGVLWSAVGVMLCEMASYWFSSLDWPVSGIGAAMGFGAGAIIYRYGFSRIAERNIRRILQKPERMCFFAFQAWRSYILIAVMILLGYALRHSHLPGFLLAFIYLAMGTGLALGSSLYYERVFREMRS